MKRINGTRRGVELRTAETTEETKWHFTQMSPKTKCHWHFKQLMGWVKLEVAFRLCYNVRIWVFWFPPKHEIITTQNYRMGQMKKTLTLTKTEMWSKGYVLVMGTWFRRLMFSSSQAFCLSSSFSWASSSEICAFKTVTCSSISWVWLPVFSPLDSRKKRHQQQSATSVWISSCSRFRGIVSNAADKMVMRLK